jgi:ATP-binding cassette, subfamily B, bacterial HlyB/CyaB
VMTVAFLFMGVYLFKERFLTIGQVVAINTLSGSLIAPILGLISNIDDFSNVKVSFEKVDEVITSKTEDFKANEKLPSHFKSIVFKDVWFQYGSDLSPWILKGINLEINRGEKVAFVGPSGSGKSTLAYMINLIYSPVKGEVYLGEISNQQLNLSELRQHVSMILQDNTVFNGSILNNIAFGEANPDLQRAIEAAQLAEAHTFISDLPMGYSTLIGEGQMNLSGGQKQRLSIARAIYKRPQILIMDEATSALDSITEKRVIQNLNNHLKETTCFIIAHRLNTIIDADRIVVVKNGKLVEQGKHAELMKAQNTYYSLFKKQINL